MQTSSVSFYNPNNLTEKELIDSFVIRKKEFQKIINDIKSSDMKYPEQHYMIEAQRGYGKTTLLKRLYFEIKRDIELKERLIPVILPEEQYNIRRLFKLWEVVAQNLELESTEFIGLYNQMDKHAKEENYEDICFKIIEQRLKEQNKKLILLIDNTEDILKKFKLIEQQKLREILLTSAEIRFIGASSEVLEYTFNYEKPFYDFFKLIKLKGLTTEETNEYFEKLGEISNKKGMNELIKINKGKIEAIRRLTGGVPRIMSLLFSSVCSDRGLAFKDIDTLSDKVTPLYKHVMDNLSPVQQEIVDVIALSWEAITTKEIADKIRMQSKEVSAQLNQLEKNGVINKIPMNKKNYMYQIKDRFFNIWYLIRFGGEKEKHQVLWLVDFLENWCSRETLINKSKNKEQDLNYDKNCNDFSTIYELSRTLLLNDKIEESIKKAPLFLQVANNTDKYNMVINEYFILLMAKKQYNSLLNVFNEKEFMLKDKYKPTYYALMYFIKNQNEKFEIEYKKVGEELKETVEEIIEEVKNNEE
ncbi:ATP-binding protein [Clostridium estertheticum]|uniref:ATP-binding protein n=1 Tax=Clostridium estertheticum TaxID=238834 RepID=UPI001C0BE53B|nr:ATP-binding protein [Clostridium estertheticum]MBU3074478.1 ATP-binding protein [Clostridium estertheticum]MBU3165942.1 ATP-binding protein [Clostridium estertheticum]